jgi:hypothetical protein
VRFQSVNARLHVHFLALIPRGTSARRTRVRWTLVGQAYHPSPLVLAERATVEGQGSLDGADPATCIPPAVRTSRRSASLTSGLRSVMSVALATIH